MKTEIERPRRRRFPWTIIVVAIVILAGARQVLKVVMGFSRIPTKAMAPTIHPNDSVSVNRLAYRFGNKPNVGDIATYLHQDSKFIFRIVGGPGDTLHMDNNVLVRNGRRVDEPYIMLTPDIPALRTFGPIKVPPGHYFFLGDNRDNSNDSRFIGFVPEDQILGRMNFVWHIGECDETP
jgi:signal peptidase I